MSPQLRTCWKGLQNQYPRLLKLICKIAQDIFHSRKRVTQPLGSAKRSPQFKALKDGDLFFILGGVLLCYIYVRSVKTLGSFYTAG